jgi:hypothetical protein
MLAYDLHKLGAQRFGVGAQNTDPICSDARRLDPIPFHHPSSSEHTQHLLGENTLNEYGASCASINPQYCSSILAIATAAVGVSGGSKLPPPPPFAPVLVPKENALVVAAAGNGLGDAARPALDSARACAASALG